MRRLAWPIAALALVALLAACAPAALGGSGNNPYPAAAGAPRLAPGGTVYVRLDHSLADLGLDAGRLQPSMWVPSGYDSEIGDLSGQFGLSVDRVPEGWTFRLHSVRVERSSERGSGVAGSPRTVYAIWSVYEVSAPESAIAGPYRFRGALRARNGGEVPITVNVEVGG